MQEIFHAEIGIQMEIEIIITVITWWEILQVPEIWTITIRTGIFPIIIEILEKTTT